MSTNGNKPGIEGAGIMKNTDEGKYNDEKIQDVYNSISDKLNSNELQRLADKIIVWHGCMVKTAHLISLDGE